MNLIPTVSSKIVFGLSANGVLIIFFGLLLGPSIPMVPYPRLMMAAHTLFLGVGTLSLLAAFALRSSLSVVGPRIAALILFGHVIEWLAPLSQAFGSVWGTNRALGIAAGQAGAPGGLPWQENLVQICQVIPSVCLLVAWGLLLYGVFQARKA